MDENVSSNLAVLCGTVAAAPVYSHSSRSESFYTFPLEIMRLSGTADRINVILRSELLESLEVSCDEKLRVIGELRSFNRGQSPL